MGKYVFKRLVIAIPTFLGITILVYFLSSLAPGSPLELLFNDSNATAEVMHDMEARLGLDQPVYLQYFSWLKELFKGNFGKSYRTGLSVWESIAERVGPTLLITLSSLFLSVLIAIPLGLMSAYKPYSGWDYFSSGLSFVGAATPNFFAGLVLVYLFSVKIKLFPSSGMYGSSSLHTFPDLLHHMILPVLVLSIQQVGSLIRQTRGSVLEVLQDDYIRTARSKGCTEKRVLFRHALRNSMAPVITRIGSMIPFLVGGAVVTEQLFSWPGLGSLMVLSINSRDYPVIMGITVIISVAVLIGNLLIDLIYCWLDPRIRHN
ncbi:ABC transporter permease [uncultured Sphaerochaeta sp.]|uniref:ABC transporter permease n=1 Tax=uncultured Sphaerochaeta sp. TaxID=886478 RepID=UPI002A0A8715|nr:ABC transporter permease [uncultured Sphaerochaeta sp.]